MSHLFGSRERIAPFPVYWIPAPLRVAASPGTCARGVGWGWGLAGPVVAVWRGQLAPLRRGTARWVWAEDSYAEIQFRTRNDPARRRGPFALLPVPEILGGSQEVNPLECRAPCVSVLREIEQATRTTPAETQGRSLRLSGGQAGTYDAVTPAILFASLLRMSASAP